MRAAMRGYIDLLRPLNCCIAALAVFIGAVVAVGFGGLSGSAFQVAVAAVIGFLFAGAGNAMNDYFDREVDRVNHPNRPIPSGRVPPTNAGALAAILFIVSALLSVLVGWLASLIVLVNLGAMYSYELRFKRRGWSGNIVISWLVASLFLFGGAAVYNDSMQALSRVSWMGLLAFLATLGREIVKDIEDVAGDIGRRTLPMVVGLDRAGFVASAVFILGVALSPIPFTMGVLSAAYLVAVTLADGIFIYCAWFSTVKPTQVSRAAKYGMVVALIAFLAGGAL
jgi:geranylgeranylglycerol-phosphate geranylgeranyltransferase